MSEKLKKLIDRKLDLKDFLKEFARIQYNLGPDGRALVEKVFIEKMKEAQDFLDETVAMPDEEKAERTKSYNECIVSSDEPSETTKANNENIERLTAELEDLEVDSPELRSFAIEALNALYPLYYVSGADILKPKTIKEWHAEQIEIAVRQVQGSIGVFQNRAREVEEINKTLDALEAEFKE